MKRSAGPFGFPWIVVPLILLAGALVSQAAFAQSPEEIVRKVVGNELWYADHDHSCWMYRDAYKSPAKNVIRMVIQTHQGNLSEIIEDSGHPPSPQEHEADMSHMQQIVDDPVMRARMRRNDQNDDRQAADLLNLLPNAFIWRLDGRENGTIKLSYHPDPNFSPPSMSARVLAAMSGIILVDESQMRLKEIDGRLDSPVEFAWGLLGRINAGGTFNVVREEIAPYEWQITQTHVHISGHALFFKNIGDQEDEWTSDYHRVPDSVNLEKADEMLRDGEAAREMHLSVPFG
ncbi:MAG TPA: hypothetical protein VMD29_06295 [Terracidiphilus sp.]|nr:hypothetical protein [Terracidiphilus sp.]